MPESGGNQQNQMNVDAMVADLLKDFFKWKTVVAHVKPLLILPIAS